MNIADFKVLTFDCYGTLIDWEAGIASVLRGWAGRNNLAVTDQALLEAFAESEPRQENSPEGFRVYPEVLRAVMRDLGKKFHRPVSEEDAAAFAGSVAATGRPSPTPWRPSRSSRSGIGWWCGLERGPGVVLAHRGASGSGV